MEADSEVESLRKNAINKIEDYMKELLISSSCDQLQTLQMMNNLTREKYKEMCVVAQRLIQQSSSITAEYSSFHPFVEQVNEIDARISYLETVVQELDRFSDALCRRFIK